MSCEAESAEMEAAQRELADAQMKCAGLSQDDPEWIRCMSDVVIAEARLASALEALRQCRTAVRVLVAEGFVTFLRVHELGSGFGGGQSNFLQAEAIFKLDTEQHRAFGFQLRDDKNLPARRGMLSLLRDAMVNNLRVRVDFLELVSTPNQNCFAIRIAVLKPRPATPPTGEMVLAT